MKEYNKALMRSDENSSMFDKISQRYDLLNKLLSFGRDRAWRKEAVNLLDVKDLGTYIDAGCGTADLSIEIARRFESHPGKVFGYDHSENMLRVGRNKVQATKLESIIELSHGDALELPVANGSVDGIISGFVVRNIDDRIGALKEWARVLKPGGRCVVLELSKPDNPIILFGYNIFANIVVPFLGLFLSKHKPYKYLIESIKAFPSSRIFIDMMKTAGFTEVKSKSMTFGVVRIYWGTRGADPPDFRAASPN